MGHWKDAAVTNDGVEMLNEWMAGRKITIVSAYGGTGTVDPELLKEQTGLMDMRQELNILGEENGPDGKTVQLQVQNTGLMAEYELNQVGVYAALDIDRDPDAEPRLLFIMELYCAIGITNNGRFDVSVSSAGIVTASYMKEVLERTIMEHNADPGAHPSILSRLDGLDTNLELVKNDGENLDARLGLLELMYRTQVNGNPFTVSFSDMSDLLVTGVWNETLKRVEF